MDDRLYPNIRAVEGLGDLIGKRVVDITGNDPDEPAFVEFLFEDGTAVRFPVGPDGFVIR